MVNQTPNSAILRETREQRPPRGRFVFLDRYRSISPLCAPRGRVSHPSLDQRNRAWLLTFVSVSSHSQAVTRAWSSSPAPLLRFSLQHRLCYSTRPVGPSSVNHSPPPCQPSQTGSVNLPAWCHRSRARGNGAVLLSLAHAHRRTIR